jgi:sensor histidine kinase regulating citrate/malate metabolism
MDNPANWLELLKGGGNAAVIVLAILGVKVAQAFLSALKGIVETMTKNHAEQLASQEQIKRAIVARDPASAKFFEKVNAG